MRGGLGHSWEASGTAGAHVAHLGARGVQPEAHLWHIWGHEWMRPGTHLGNIWACAPHLAVTLLSRCWWLHGPRSALRCVRANKSPTTSGLVLLLLFFFVFFFPMIFKYLFRFKNTFHGNNDFMLTKIPNM